jgi:hypothetical protein
VDTDNAAPGGGAEAIVPVPAVTPAEAPAAIDVSEAARALSNWRREKNTPAAPQAQELASEPSSDPQPEAPADPEAPDPAELPPIDAPRAWTSEEKERFQTLPRELQAYLSEREQERDRDLRRRQNEAADARKAIEAELHKAEQVRQDYEQRLPVLLQTLQAQSGEFSDVRTFADVQRMAAEDPTRYLRWDAQQKQISVVQQQVEEARQRQHHEASQSLAKWHEEQDKSFGEREPDILDPVKGPQLKQSVLKELHSSGFSDQELSHLWNGPFRDAKVQSLILDAVRYRTAKVTAQKSAPKPVPPVQRPGAAPNKGAQLQAQIEQQSERLKSAKGMDAVRAATELLRTQRQAAR